MIALIGLVSLVIFFWARAADKDYSSYVELPNGMSQRVSSPSRFPLVKWLALGVGGLMILLQIIGS